MLQAEVVTTQRRRSAAIVRRLAPISDKDLMAGRAQSIVKLAAAVIYASVKTR